MTYRKLNKVLFFRTHYQVLDTSSGVFTTREQALRFLDALRKKVEDICRKKKCSCLFYGVVSISEEGNVKRTADGSKLIDETLTRLPHIHCILLLEKQSAVLKELKKYLNKTRAIKMYREINNGKSGFYADAIHKPEDLSNRLIYRVSQGMNCRIVDTCTKEFATKYAGDFVSLIEAQEKAMGGSKLVFPQYANMKLGTDESVFDFSSNSNKIEEKSNEVWKSDSADSEVWKFDIENIDLSHTPKNDENSPILPSNTPILSPNIDICISDVTYPTLQDSDDEVYNEIYINILNNNFSYTHT